MPTGIDLGFINCYVENLSSVMIVDIGVFLGQFKLVPIGWHKSLERVSNDGEHKGVSQSCLKLNSVRSERKILGGFVESTGWNFFSLQVKEDLAPWTWCNLKRIYISVSICMYCIISHQMMYRSGGTTRNLYWQKSHTWRQKSLCLITKSILEQLRASLKALSFLDFVFFTSEKHNTGSGSNCIILISNVILFVFSIGIILFLNL